MGRRRNSPVNVMSLWVRRQSMKVKSFLALVTVLSSLIALKYLVADPNNFYIAGEAIHAAGIVVLIYKLNTKKTCSGLSLKSQELTAIFQVVRLCCSINMDEASIHTVLDFATLVPTIWVIYMMRFQLKSTYIKELDNLPIYYMVVPCAILALFIHPYTHHLHISRILWAFSLYLESVSVMPQLQLMQNAKMVEPLTSHYVFALGIARFLGCADWIFHVYETGGRYLYFIGYGHLWVPMALLSEIVQTFILADFCYYYIKRVMDGQLLTRLPSSVQNFSSKLDAEA